MLKEALDMTRRTLFSALGLAPLLKAADPCPIQVNVTSGPAVEVVIPQMAKADLVSIISDFLGAGPAGVRQDPTDQKRNTAALAKVLSTAKDITFTIRTRC